MIIVIRNLIFLINFIPVIQLLGLALLTGFLAIIPGLLGDEGALGTLVGFSGFGMIMPALVVLYVILIVARFSSIKQARK